MALRGRGAPQLGRPPSKRCEKSYDMLRLNASVPSCGLLGSHDDFSVVVDSLPPNTAVVTQLRCGYRADVHTTAQHAKTLCPFMCVPGVTGTSTEAQVCLTCHAQTVQSSTGAASRD